MVNIPGILGFSIPGAFSIVRSRQGAVTLPGGPIITAIMGRGQRELVLVKVKSDARTRAEIIEIVEIFRGKIVDVGKGTLSVEVTGPSSKLRALEDLLKPYGMVELARTGTIALPRG